jgi:hypothetical protein
LVPYNICIMILFNVGTYSVRFNPSSGRVEFVLCYGGRMQSPLYAVDYDIFADKWVSEFIFPAIIEDARISRCRVTVAGRCGDCVWGAFRRLPSGHPMWLARRRQGN